MDTSSKGIGFYDKDLFCIKEDKDLVAESIKRIIMTNHSERVGMAQFGGNLKPMLFEQLDNDSLIQMESSLRESIDLYEPRAIIKSLDVTADADNSKVNIAIYFNYVGRPNADPRFLELAISIE